MADNIARGRRIGRRPRRQISFGTQDMPRVNTSIPSVTNVGLGTSTPSIPHVFTSSPSTPHTGTSSSSSSSAHPTATPSVSSLHLTPVQPVLGTYDVSDRKTWIAPGAKFQLLPAKKGPRSEIPKIIKSKFDGAWSKWSDVPQEVKNMWFKEFKKKYKWMPEHNFVIKATFNHIGQKMMKDTMNKIRAGTNKDEWIPAKVRQQLDAIWAGPDFQKKSEIAKKNRAIDKGASLYMGGSVSIAVHRSRLNVELNREPTAFEIMKRTKRNKTGEWANEKAKNIAEEFLRRLAEVHANDLEDNISDHFTASDNAIFLDVVGGQNKKGHVYGLGPLGAEFVFSSNHCTQSTVDPVVDYPQIVANVTKKLEKTKSQLENKNSEMQEKLNRQSSELAQTKELLQQLVKHLGFQPAYTKKRATEIATKNV